MIRTVAGVTHRPEAVISDRLGTRLKILQAARVRSKIQLDRNEFQRRRDELRLMGAVLLNELTVCLRRSLFAAVLCLCGE